MIKYRIRKSQIKQPNGNISDAFSIGVPQHIATFIPGDVKFFPELTSEGILYRALRDESIPLPANAPEWMSPEIEATLTEEERKESV